MTFCPEGDLARHLRFLVEYDDGAMDAFAMPQATLQQGTSWVIVTIAGEWQRGGHLRDGNIVAIRAKQFVLN